MGLTAVLSILMFIRGMVVTEVKTIITFIILIVFIVQVIFVVLQVLKRGGK
jgi:dolichyl-phosphate-mannose--protein O-mannosyl transferase